MTHKEKRLYLIKELLLELPQYRKVEIPNNVEEQKQLLRSLMNIRSPRPIGKEFLKIQDEYLSAEVEEKGITDSDTLPVSPINSRLILWRGDITTLKVDAIVNAANSSLRGCFLPCHSCVDNIIHSVSGIQLRLACDELMTEQGNDEPTGVAHRLLQLSISHAVMFCIQWVPLCMGSLQNNIADSLRTAIDPVWSLPLVMD